MLKKPERYRDCKELVTWFLPLAGMLTQDGKEDYWNEHPVTNSEKKDKNAYEHYDKVRDLAL
jgi:hypothetical protein